MLGFLMHSYNECIPNQQLVPEVKAKLKAKPGFYGNIKMRSLMERKIARFFDALLKRWTYEEEKYQVPGLPTAYLPDFKVEGLLLGSDDPVYVEARPIGNKNEKAVAFAQVDVPVLLFYGAPAEEGAHAVLLWGDEQQRVLFGRDGFLQIASKTATLLGDGCPEHVWRAAVASDAFEYEAANRQTLQRLIGIEPAVLGALTKNALLLLQLIGATIREPAKPEQIIAGGEAAGLNSNEAIAAFKELVDFRCLVTGSQRLDQMKARAERSFNVY